MPPEAPLSSLEQEPPSDARAISVAILALGGEGGGVLADWLVDLAEHEGFIAQATSVPGVAQRTGATIYYVEMFPPTRDKQEPVLALMPTPGDVDLVVASELMEAGRAVQRGLVTPDRTTFVFSTHRVFAMTEKIAMADGRADASKLLDGCRKAAYRTVAADMQRLAEDNRSVISAVLLGAIAGSGALPFARAAYEEAIRRAGVGVDASLSAFAAGWTAATTGTSMPQTADAKQDAAQPMPAEGFPPQAAAIVAEGVRRLTDYQDADYAGLYMERLRPIAALDAAHGDGSARLIAAVARYLALGMSYEDTIRVADLKIRAERFARVRAEVRAQPDQVLRIREFLHPRVQEIAETLPAGLGRRLRRPGLANWLIARLTARGRRVETTSVPGFLLLWTVAALRRWRRNTLRFALEQSRIEGWLDRIKAVASSDYALATEIALCQRLVKGYGETHERGLGRYEKLMRAADALRGDPQAATRLAALRQAAMADETGQALDRALTEQSIVLSTESSDAQNPSPRPPPARGGGEQAAPNDSPPLAGGDRGGVKT